MISLLPADTYTVINRSIITDDDKKNIISLYEPIIGPVSVALYFTLLRDLRIMDVVSSDYTHHHLMSVMKSSLDVIKIARESLEAIGLLKTYFKEGDNNSYVYELFSPLSPKEFFASPILNITLYNNLGKLEYEIIKSEYQLPKIELKDYDDISKELNMVYKSSNVIEPLETRDKNSLGVKLLSNIDFDLLVSSMPKGLLKESALSKKNKELINELAFIYDLDTLKMIELLRTVINDKGTFDKEELRKGARKYYQYNNNGKLPTLVYRTQPEYLKTPEGDVSPMAQIIYMFENTSPHDFLRMKNKGVNPSPKELKILEYLIVDVGLQPAVVNVLIDYVLKKNNNKLVQSYIETIAGQWKRCNIETAQEAIELARKESSKNSKKVNKNSKNDIKEPVWLKQDIVKEEISPEEEEELQELLKDFR
ncbi:MAG: DnaD domain protein [Bacilli bacterium]|nr:DnaD domain protein [Bacilli bacterium]